MDYNKFHAERAMKYHDVRCQHVLVIGCNTGSDCKYFVSSGAKEVIGIDVIPEIGRGFTHPNVRYIRSSAEAIPLEPGRYDLVYCFATMEHIYDIEAAFYEMARVTKPGGLIYCVSSPLWNSRNGHHYPQYFSGYPWAHLRLSPEQALWWLREHNVVIDPKNGTAENVVVYMFDNKNFNMKASAAYISACNKIKGFKVLRNDLVLEPEEVLDQEVRRELESRGFSSQELRAVTHHYIARKHRASWFSGMLQIFREDLSCSARLNS
ncbi:MAG: class I SAM-dependent methyltransferase [Nitrospira sp.]|nr:class I SAM-dependent methyltransferase [Nitrospira sp.]MDH4242229.1 class I SAM-dependent methyltransferase [Nitrospira sp.]MDH4356289.1 class I SAM-dependent methyltransferase [Nitrospira sp.]MDH5317625.1 class I SAM-dependent methyltransferase [Nitrospira sp.]